MSWVMIEKDKFTDEAREWLKLNIGSGSYTPNQSIKQTKAYLDELNWMVDSSEIIGDNNSNRYILIYFRYCNDAEMFKLTWG